MEKKTIKNYLLLLVTFVAGIAASALGVAIAVISVDGANGEGKFTDTTATIADDKRLSPERLEDYYQRIVVEQDPTSTPLDTILRKSKRKSDINSFIFKTGTVDWKPVEDTIKTAVTDQAASEEFTLNVVTAKLFSQFDTILIPGYTIKTERNEPLVLWIESVSGSILTARAMNATSAFSLSVGTKIYRMGKAHDELAVQTSPYTSYIGVDENYCQIFKCQVEVGKLLEAHKANMDWNMSDQERVALKDMKMGIEASCLFGSKAKALDSNGHPIYMTGGLVNYVKNVINYCDAEGVVYKNWWTVAAKAIFTGNSGSRTRVMFMGSEFTSRIEQNEEYVRTVKANETVTSWGIDWQDYTSSFGRVLCIRHELLDMYGYGDRALVLDMDNIEKVNFKGGLQTLSLDQEKLGVRNSNANVITEITGVKVLYPGTHAIICPSPAAK